MSVRINPARALLVAVLALVSLPCAAASASAQDTAPGKAVIVSLPTLRWSDVVEHQPQAILDLLEESAAASTSVRTIGPNTSPGEAYVTIGAGNRSTVDDLLAGRAYAPDDKVSSVPAGQTYTNRTGYEVAGSSVVHLGLASIRKAAQTLNYDADPGALGTAMADAGFSTAVVANADVQRQHHREAALAMMDVEGRVAGGDVSSETLAPDPNAPFGSQIDVDASVAATEDALRDHDAVLVEASDLARVDSYRPLMTADAHASARADAIDAADQLVGQLASSLDLERDLLMLVGPYSPFAEPADLTVFAMAGPDVEPGVALGSTRRDGYVTLKDIAPTLLDYFGVETPDDVMTGNVITSQGGGPVTLDTAKDFVGANESATFRDGVMPAITVTYILSQVAVYVLAIYAFTRARRAHWRDVAADGALWVMAIPAAAFLLGLFRFDKLGVGGFATALITGAGAIAWLAWMAFRRLGAGRIGPPFAIASFTLLVLLVDAVTGAHLQIDTIFGYSPTVAGRFAGYGNLAFGILAICAVTTAAGIWALPRMRRNGSASMPRVGWTWWVALGVLVVTLIVNGYPSWGSDVGGVLATTPSYAALLILLAGWKLGWRRIIILGLGAVAVLGVFALIDLSRPATQRTHLARFVESIGDGGALTTLGRKIDANLSILTSSTWAWLVPIGLVFLILLIRRDPMFIATLRRHVPGFQEWLVGAFMVAILGMAVNDSGVAVPAAMLGIALPYLIYAGAKSEPAEGLAGDQPASVAMVDHGV